MDDPRPLSTDKYSDSFMLHRVAPCYVYYKHQATNKNSKMLHMKTKREIRYDNLKKLVDEAGGLTELLEKSKSWPMVGSKKRLSRATLDQILKKRLTGKGAVRGIGDDLVRKIEDELGLGHGYMDTEHGATVRSSPSNVTSDLFLEMVTIFLRSDVQRQNAIVRFAQTLEEGDLSVGDSSVPGHH